MKNLSNHINLIHVIDALTIQEKEYRGKAKNVFFTHPQP